jgi:hypothetical protein
MNRWVVGDRLLGILLDMQGIDAISAICRPRIKRGDKIEQIVVPPTICPTAAFP